MTTDHISVPRELLPFNCLALGVRFTYPEFIHRVYVKIGHDLVAAWDEQHATASWVGQGIYTFGDDLTAGVHVVLAEQPVGQSGPWISVEDRLPEKGQFILVPRFDGMAFCGKYSPLGDTRRCLDHHLGKWFGFDHWMPLPPAPTKEKGN